MYSHIYILAMVLVYGFDVIVFGYEDLGMGIRARVPRAACVAVYWNPSPKGTGYPTEGSFTLVANWPTSSDCTKNLTE